MFSRRKFLSRSALGTLGLSLGSVVAACKNEPSTTAKASTMAISGQAVILSTWNNVEANTTAWQTLEQGGSILDALEQGVRIPEGDPDDMSVGYGGLPDRDGNVTLDACIMDAQGNAGSVSFLQHIKHPISVARKVMEETPHVMLSGDGALQFALAQGFEKENLLTAEAKAAWEKWKEKSEYKPIINIENHDTIGMVGVDADGELAGACTTSGLAYKMHGRVGDSPIIGAGMFVDNEVGGAAATGMGEAVLKTLGSFLVVELMRQGKSPQEACEEAVQRIVLKQSNYKEFQVGYIALSKSGEVGAYCIQPGFVYAVTRDGETEVFDAKSYIS